MLITNKCPGQDKRNLQIENVRCRFCSYEAEIFSDENKIRCPNCKNEIIKTKLPACVDWCQSARECLGEQRWQNLKGGK